MSKKKNDGFYTEGSLPIRFDSWLRLAMKQIIEKEVQALAKRKRKECFLDEMFIESIDSVDEGNDPFEDLWMEKVNLGNAEIRISNDRLARALDSLSEKEKMIIGFIFLDMKTGELAKATGLNPHTITNYKRIIFRKLKKLLLEGEDGKR